jgi:hypothetical protein
MPRRPVVLRPEDGPLARFALELRALQDSAGGAAKSIDQIAVQYNIHRDTLYAALRGKRIPSRPVLAALVSAWGGDEGKWMTKRRSLEVEMETMRVAQTSRRPANITRKSSRVKGIAESPRVKGIGEPKVKAEPEPSTQDADRQRIAEFAAELRELRERAGHPSLRDIGDASPGYLPASTLSDVFLGKRLPSWNTTHQLISALNEFALRGGHGPAEPLDAPVDKWLERWMEIKLMEEEIRNNSFRTADG